MEQQKGVQLSAEQVQQYQKLKVEYSELFRATLDLDDEKKEHLLVIDAVKNLQPERRSWRLVGGVLVERNVGEVMVSLKENVEFLDKTSQNYQQNLKQKEQALMEFEIKYNLRPTREGVNKQGQQDTKGENKKTTGVLA